ncbi:MAG: hypothetical protein L6R39_001058 [Caloplaca ligustica]|nr:MAG: hypothetical protein L6R39_001058 [Caloplaca ligustica]
MHRYEWDRELETVDEPLYPGILSTCRTIWEEARPILYGQHIFCFGFPLMHRSRNVKCQEVKKACRDLMSYPIDDWSTAMPVAVRNSRFAAFLRKIGAHNSSLLRRVELRSYVPSGRGSEAVKEVILATKLCVKHLPNLQEWKFLEQEYNPGRWAVNRHPFFESPFNTNGHFQRLYKALETFTDKIHWLKVFEYRGRFQPGNATAIEKVNQLRDFVKKRAEDRQRKEIEQRKVSDMPK